MQVYSNTFGRNAPNAKQPLIFVVTLYHCQWKDDIMRHILSNKIRELFLDDTGSSSVHTESQDRTTSVGLVYFVVVDRVCVGWGVFPIITSAPVILYKLTY